MVGDITQKRNKVWGGHSHAPLQTHNVLMRPVHAQPAQPLPNRTHQLRRRKHDKGGKRMVGRHEREEKYSLGSERGGGHSHAPLQTHNVLMRPVHAQPAQAFAQPNSLPAAKET